MLFKINERSKYSYICVAVFFSGKSHKVCLRSVLIFRCLTCDFFFKFSAFLLSSIEQQKCKIHEKRDRLLISKMELNYHISQRNKSSRTDPVFSIWVDFGKKVHHKVFYKYKDI